MINYNDRALYELENWKRNMRKKPTILDRASKGVQNKVNNMLPDKYHELITAAIKNLTRVVLFGSKYITNPPSIINS